MINKNTFLKLAIPAAIVIAGASYLAWLNLKGPEQTFCTQEAKLCSDGSYVGRSGPMCEFAACPKEDLIVVESPKANETISSPLVITGRARGNWYFEASFPVRLYDALDRELAVAIATAKTDWMTTEFVEFQAVMNFPKPTTATGYLIFQKDNPSGLPEHDDQLKVPVNFNLQAVPTQTVRLYYYNPNNDRDEEGNIMCSKAGLVGVERQIPVTATPIQDTIRLLLLGGLSPSELGEGLTTGFPLPGVELVGASLKSGVLTLEFKDPQYKTSGGACRVSTLWAQIETTATQFAGVNSVRFIPQELFQP